jgi:glycosyltransferase involved in cell wall biosynthesis
MDKERKIKIDYMNSFPIVLNIADSIHVYEICNNLQKLNCEVRLIAPKNNIKTRGIFKSIFFQLFLPLKVIKIWKNNKPDYIYSRANLIFVMPAILAKMYKIPSIVEVNGTIEEELIDIFVKRFRNILIKVGIFRSLEKFNYKISSKIITVTPELKEYIVNKFKIDAGKIFVVENGVDANLFKPEPKNNNKVIGFVGGIQNWQGLSYVIKALPAIINKFPEARLVLIGDGPDKASFEKLVKKLGLEKHVDFIGAVDHELTPGYINSFNICVAYYTKDRDGITSPFKIYEYLSSGKPTIVSNIKGVGDRFSKITVVIEPENSTIFAEKVINLLNDEAEQDRLSKAGREFILDGHSWHDVAKKTLNIITSQYKGGS